MSARVIVHAGIHKTGSTAIQSALAAARPQLAEVGFSYPVATDERDGHHDLAFHIRNVEPNSAIAANYRRAYEAAAASQATLVLSSEELEFAVVSGQIRNLQPLFPGADFRVIYYVCRQDILLEREYNQHVKQRSTSYSGSISDFYLKHNFGPRMNYFACLRHIERHFGSDAAMIRIFEPDRLSGGDVVRDFYNAAGLPESALPVRNFRDNRSLSAPALDLVRRINALDLDPRRRAAIVRRVERADDGSWPRPNLLSLQNRHDLLDRFRGPNEQLFDWLGEANAWDVSCLEQVEEPAAADDRAVSDRFLARLLSEPD